MLVDQHIIFHIQVVQLDIHVYRKNDVQMIVLVGVLVILKLGIVSVNLGVSVLIVRNQFVSNTIHCVNSVMINNADVVRKGIM